MNNTTKDLLIRHYEEQLKNLSAAIKIITIANRDLHIYELTGALNMMQNTVDGIRHGADEIKKGDT